MSTLSRRRTASVIMMTLPISDTVESVVGYTWLLVAEELHFAMHLVAVHGNVIKCLSFDVIELR